MLNLMLVITKQAHIKVNWVGLTPRICLQLPRTHSNNHQWDFKLMHWNKNASIYKTRSRPKMNKSTNSNNQWLLDKQQYKKQMLLNRPWKRRPDKNLREPMLFWSNFGKGLLRFLLPILKEMKVLILTNKNTNR